MDRLKTLFKYAIWVILFFIFSEIMINLNIETTYRDIGKKGNLKQVSVYQAQATKINGRIKGSIFNDKDNRITSNYLRIDLYSERDVLLGSKYIDVESIRENETKDFELYFKVQDVDYYELKFTDEREEEELPELVKDLSRQEVILGTIITFLIFW